MVPSKSSAYSLAPLVLAAATGSLSLVVAVRRPHTGLATTLVQLTTARCCACPWTGTLGAWVKPRPIRSAASSQSGYPHLCRQPT